MKIGKTIDISEDLGLNGKKAREVKRDERRDEREDATKQSDRVVKSNLRTKKSDVNVVNNGNENRNTNAIHATDDSIKDLKSSRKKKRESRNE